MTPLLAPRSSPLFWALSLQKTRLSSALQSSALSCRVPGCCPGHSCFTSPTAGNQKQFLFTLCTCYYTKSLNALPGSESSNDFFFKAVWGWVGNARAMVWKVYGILSQVAPLIQAILQLAGAVVSSHSAICLWQEWLFSRWFCRSWLKADMYMETVFTECYTFCKEGKQYYMHGFAYIFC